MTNAQFDRMLGNGAHFAFILVGVVAFIVVLALGKTILAPLSLAIIIGMMFGPVADMVEHRGVPSALSAGVVVLIFLGMIALAAMMFAGPLSEWVGKWPALWKKFETQLQSLQGVIGAVENLQSQMKSVMGKSDALSVQVQDGGPVTDVALMAPSLLADILLFLAGLYFFLATRHSLRISILSLSFSRRMRWRTAHVFRDVEQQVSQFLLASATINVGVGVCVALMTWLLGLPSPLLWGALAAVMNFVPYVGQAVMFAVLFAVGLGTQDGWVSILLPLFAYGAINLISDQIIFPHLVGKALTLNPFVIFVSIAFWIWVWGPIGGFVAVPSLLVLKSILSHLLPTKAIKQPASVQRKLAEKATVDAVESDPTSRPPEPPEVFAQGSPAARVTLTP